MSRSAADCGVHLGFKSVFTVADVVVILSGDFKFKFHKAEELGMIAPIPVREEGKNGWTTFRLHIRGNVDIPELSGKLEEVEPTLLLFLRRLRELHLSVNNHSLLFKRGDLPNDIFSLEGNGKTVDYLVVRRSVKAYCGEQKRANVDHTEVVLAFPIDSQRAPVICDQNVHAFLPLRSYGFKVS